MAAYTVKVEADLTGTTAFGAAATFTDITAVVLTTGIGDPVEIDNWRPDQLSSVSPSTMDLVLDNTAGTYKPGNAGMKPLASRFRVTVTVAGTPTIVFDGFGLSFTAGFVGVVKPVTRIRCVDILAVFGSRTPLRSLTLEETLVDSPRALYPLDEPAGATSAGDITGQRIPAVVTTSKYGAGTLTFGVASTGVLTPSVVSFLSPDTNTTSNHSRQTYLALPSDVLPAGPGWTIEVLVKTPSTPPVNHDETLVMVPATWAASNIAVNIVLSQGVLAASVTIGGSVGFVTTNGARNIYDGGWHLISVTYGADDKTTVIYVDGALDATLTSPGTIGWANQNQGVKLGLSVASGAYAGAFSGQMALVGFYPAVLSAARIAAHYGAIFTGFAGESTNAHVARLVGYRTNLGTSLDAGVGTVGVHDTDGVTLQQALLDTADAEVGVVYVNGSAQIAFRNRAHLFNPATALTLNAANGGEVLTDVAPRVDDQGLVNDATISRPGGADQRALDSASVALYGTNDGSGTRIVNSDQAALDIANYLVQNFKTPKVSVGSVTSDIKLMASTAQANAILARQPLDRLTVSNLPATSPAIDGFIQGRHISLAVDKLEVTFNVSTLTLPVMVADDATLGICDTTNVAAF